MKSVHLCSPMCVKTSSQCLQLTKVLNNKKTDIESALFCILSFSLGVRVSHGHMNPLKELSDIHFLKKSCFHF